MLSSDHSPSVPELKLLEEGNFLKAWGGISSLQVGIFFNCEWSLAYITILHQQYTSHMFLVCFVSKVDIYPIISVPL